MPRYAYLGPEGTFTEAALLGWLQGRPGDLVPCSSVDTALLAVRSGDVRAAMVPLENSVEGSVSATLDALATGSPLVIIAEALVPVTFALMARPGTPLGAVRTITTHPHAEAQCRAWVAENLPESTLVLSASTAAAAAAVAEPGSPFDAAIAGPLAAEVYGLDVLADGVGAHSGAQTRFVLVSGPVPPGPATGSDKTSLVLVMGEDHPGALLEILTEFAVRGVNLTRIESRPTGGGIGDYFFSIDIEGHVDDARVGEALTGLRRVCAEVRYLGSYPRSSGARPLLRRGVTDEEFREAQAWLARIREGRT
ncbi:MAG: prephenate dehydratase [Actinomycetes bacterium]